MRLLLAACFAVGLGEIAYAEAYVTRGAGANTCASFANTYRVDPELTDRVFQAWAMGYMSGINISAVARSEGIYDLNAITPDQIKRYLRQYCDGHPLADYVDGVSELLKSLPIVKP